MDSFKEAGIGAPGILRAMTTRVAVLPGIDQERGAIRVGRAADLIATPMNPLRDIEAPKNINFVNFLMKDGRAVGQAVGSGLSGRPA